MNAQINLTPDVIVIAQIGPFALNGTIVFTWFVMLVLVLGSVLLTRKLSTSSRVSRGQATLEAIVSYIRDQIEEMTHQEAAQYLPFLGTLFLYISVANLLNILPVYRSPTGSLSTTAALATCVFVAVPVFGIRRRGLLSYLKQYIEPSPFMLPFNIISELSRTLALAVRLFGNVMSGSMIIGVLLSIAPFFVPIVMQVLDLLIGQIQAYIFAALATIYIASATRIEEGEPVRRKKEQPKKGDN